jgi:DNA-directed RNA polymerase beta' subunit
MEGSDAEIFAKEKMSEYYFIGEKFIQKKVNDYLDNIIIYKVGEDTRKIKLVKYDVYETPWWFEFAQNNATPEHWVIVCKFDLNKLYSAKVTLNEIAISIEKEIGKTKKSDKMVKCVCSPLICGEIHIFINFAEVYSYTRPKIDGALPNKLITPENVLFYNVRDIFIPEIKNVIVRGVPGINKIFVKKDANGQMKIDTQGINLQDILSGTYGTPSVLIEKTTCDKMHDILNVLGIEAVRSFLVADISRVLSFDGSYINIRHISLLVDIMLRRGDITPIGRNGMGPDTGPIAKAMFEQPVKNITGAASGTMESEDKVKSISANVMCGGISNIGSNTVTVIDTNRKPLK